jgi:hypothetical protein
MEEFLLTQEDPQTCDPLQWSTFTVPEFVSLAHDILSVEDMFKILARILYLGSAVAVEQIFSGGRDRNPTQFDGKPSMTSSETLHSIFRPVI